MIDVPASASPHVARAITTARNLIAGATSANTRRSYETGWRQFTAHAQSLGLEPLGAHPALVATFLGSLRDGGASAQTGIGGGGPWASSVPPTTDFVLVPILTPHCHVFRPQPTGYWPSPNGRVKADKVASRSSVLSW